jgi:hypothetical protein
MPTTFAAAPLIRSNFAAIAGSASERSATYRDSVCSRTIAIA